MSRSREQTDADFQRWIEPLLPRAAAYAYAIVGNREDAEDALQEAALRGYLNLDSYDRSRSFKGWWFAIVRNCCRDLIRKRQARPASTFVEQADAQSQTQYRVDQQDELAHALGQLSAAHREILELRYFGDCSYRDIAASLGIPVGTVMSRLHAARESLATAYREILS
jgi:RNA polymerase sigma-70 factor (ECF subfamily)